MPNVEQFLQGFGLVQGLRLSGFVCTSATATHETITQYKEYKYSITLVFQNEGSNPHRQLLQGVSDIVNQVHDIKAIRNVYRCTIDGQSAQVTGLLSPIDSEVYGTVIFKFIGHATR